MSADQLRAMVVSVGNLTEYFQADAGSDDSKWAAAELQAVAALLRVLADALEKGPEPCGRMLTPAAKGGFPVYDSTAILAAEMRGEERMRERCAKACEAAAEKYYSDDDCDSVAKAALMFRARYIRAGAGEKDA